MYKQRRWLLLEVRRDEGIAMNEEYYGIYSQNDWRLYHHGVKNQKWGVRNGPPYPLKRGYLVKEALDRGDISTKLNPEMQNKHMLNTKEYKSGRSYFTISMDELQKYVDEYAGTGTALMNKKNGEWSGHESVTLPKYVGVAVNSNTGETHRTRRVKIHYSKGRTHVVPYYKNNKKK